jgi:hypothetical protein
LSERAFGVRAYELAKNFGVYGLLFSFSFMQLAGGKFPDLLECTIPCMHGKAGGKSIATSKVTAYGEAAR